MLRTIMQDSKIYNQLPVVAKITENKIIIIKKNGPNQRKTL